MSLWFSTQVGNTAALRRADEDRESQLDQLRTAALTAQSMTFRGEIDKLRSQNTQRKADFRQFNLRIERLEEDFHTYKTDNKEFRAGLEKLDANTRIMRASSMSLRRIMDKLRNQIEMGKTEMVAMRQEVTSMKAETGEFRRAIQDYEDLGIFARNYNASFNDASHPASHRSHAPPFTLKRKHLGIEQEDAYNNWLSRNKRQKSTPVDDRHEG
jgi:chromosome segregation ATPase